MDEEQQGVETTEQPVQAAPQSETEATAVTETPSVEDQGGQEDELPTEPDKQREAFIRMRQENKALKEQLSQTAAPVADEEVVLNQFRQRQVPQTEINGQMSPEEAIYHMQQLAHQGQATAQQVVELTQQLEDQKLYSEFPELNPENPDFKKPENRAFEKHVAGMYVLEQLKGNKPDLVSLARRAKADFGLLTQPQKEAIAQQVQQEATQLEQATTEARGSHANIPQKNEAQEEAMRQGARRGDPEAIAALLKG